MEREVLAKDWRTKEDKYDHNDAVEDYLIDYCNDLEMDAGFKTELLNTRTEQA